MSWIKRNLFFFIGSVVALALMGLAGFFLFKKYQLNNEAQASLASDYEKLKRLKSQNPHPGNDKVDNIAIAREQQGQLSNTIGRIRSHFAPIPRIPSEQDEPKITDQALTTALSRTIDQLQKQATNSSVILTPGYNFSFEAEKNKLSFNPASLLPLSIQLGEVKAICDVLFAAKINSLDGLRRERVAAEDSAGGLQTDYTTEKTVTNELAVITPYELSFKCFSSELGTVLAGFAGSPHAFLVKTINVETAPAAVQETVPGYVAPTPVYTPQPVYTPPGMQPNPTAEDPNAAARFASRYGLSGRYGAGGGANYGGVQLRTGPAQPTYAPPGYAAQPAVASRPGVLPTVLDERQLRVTIHLLVVKMLPPKKA
jgi:hypothetical protein